MSDKFMKLNASYGVIEFPLTFAELKEAVDQFPKSERAYYELTFKALKSILKDNENIYYIATGDAKLLNSGGFIIVAESAVFLTYLKNSMRSKAEFEKIDYLTIKNIDYDLLPQVNSSMGSGSVIIELNGILSNKNRTIHNIHHRDLDDLVAVLRNRIDGVTRNDEVRKDRNSTNVQSKQNDLKRFFGSNAGNQEQRLMDSNVAAIPRLKQEFMPNENAIVTVPVKYFLPNGKKVKGLLTATNQRVIFVSDAIINDTTKVFHFKKIDTISLENGQQVHIVSSMKKYIFEIRKEDSGEDFLIECVNNAKNGFAIEEIEKLTPPAELDESTIPSFSQSTEPMEISQVHNPSDKYQLLKQIAELRDQGILTEEEFQSEKTKILNS